MQKSFVVTALLAVSCGAQAASDADLAAIALDHRRLKKSLQAMGVTVAARDERTDLD